MDILLRRNLSASLRDGLAYSLMVGLGESFIAAYVLAKGFSEFSASLISTSPLLAGALLQLFAPIGIRWLGSYPRWVILAASVQALSLLVLAGSAFVPNITFTTVFIICSGYWATGMSVGPAWNAWMGAIVPLKIRTQFFSNRSLWCHVFTFIGLVTGGLTLQFLRNDHLMSSFVLLFALSALARFVSVYYLSRQSHPQINHSSTESIHLSHMSQVFTHSPLRRFMVFLLLYQMACNFSGGLFTPYMLAELHLDYAQYMALLAAALLARVLTMHFARGLINQFGLRQVFFASLLLCTTIPYLWTLSRDYSWLFVFQVLSGIGWGFYELIAFLTLFNDLPLKERASVLTFYNLLQTVGIVVGSLAGGLIFRAIGHNQSAYFLIFESSTYLRVLALLALPGFPWQSIRLRNWIELRPISVRAQGGLLSRPIILRLPIPRPPRRPGAKKRIQTKSHDDHNSTAR